MTFGRASANYLDLSDRQSVVSAAMVKDVFLGLNMHGDTVLSPVDRHHANLKTLVGKQIVSGTYHRYVKTSDRLHLFLRRRKNKEDISLLDITPQFIGDFERFLFAECGCHRNTVMKRMQNLKTVVAEAHNNGQISVNPFASYKFRFEAGDRGFLSEEELMTLMRHPVSCPLDRRDS